MCFSWEGDHAPADTIRRAHRTGGDKDWLKMQRARNKKAKLRQSGSFVEAMRSLVQSFQIVENQLDHDQYKRAWGFEYPSAELAEIRRFLSQPSPSGGALDD